MRHTPLAPALAVFGIEGERSDLLSVGLSQPEGAILGLTLPAHYAALGVIASSVIANPPQRVHQEAALALAVHRDGSTISLLASASGELASTSNPHGWLIDACHRAVGLPTVPCTVASLAFPLALWLDRLMVAVVGGPASGATNGAAPGTSIRWEQAVALCPVPNRWRSQDPIDLGTTLASTTPSWGALRQATVRGERSPVGVTPEHARWMDDAMFARWCMGGFPELDSLRADVEFLAAPEVAENLELTLRAAWAAFG